MLQSVGLLSWWFLLAVLPRQLTGSLWTGRLLDLKNQEPV